MSAAPLSIQALLSDYTQIVSDCDRIQMREAEMCHLGSRCVPFGLCGIHDVMNNEHVVVLFCESELQITINN